jgi:Calx-beta domain/Carboxypeptidase regulatory-like domain
VGNMGLGFSASDATVTFPSIWYTGRLAADPPGTMPQGEGVIMNGTGSQTSTGHRWGDYTSMSVDPSDDCTLWYMNEYYPVTSATAWRLRVGAFKFPDCPAGGGSGIQGTVSAFGGGPLAGVAVVPSAGTPTTTDGAGHYLLSLPAGTYDVTYSLAGYYPQTVSGIVVPPATTVTQDAVLTAVGGGPDLSIGDASTPEGNAGNTDLFFPVTLSVPSGSTITADFTTQDGTATTADNDYVPIAGTIVFNPGETSHNVTVSVVGDLTVEPDENFFVSLSNVTSANVLDGIGEGTIINDDFPLPQASKTELIHGSNLGRNLVVPDFFPIRTHVHQSWEVVVDATTGDIVGSGGPEVVRLDSDGTTVIQTATAIGTGVSKSLRWENAGATSFDGFVRVQSLGCTTNCTPEDSYRIRSYDTSYGISRFNNSATQITILVIQNTSTDTVTGTIWLWDTAGAPVTTQPLNLTANATLVLNTASVAPGAAGTITVTHNGRYASLAGKAVAVEPATGFTFDTPMVPKAR